jgi:hypothetical protein
MVGRPRSCGLLDIGLGGKNVPSRFRIRSDSDKPAHSSKKWKRIFGRDVRLNAVDLVFMIDGKTAPNTYEQDEHYEKPAGAAPATGRLSRVSPNALQAISGSEERTEDEPPDHACITTATIASIGGRHASSAWTFQIHRTGNCRTSHFPLRRRNLIPSRPRCGSATPNRADPICLR